MHTATSATTICARSGRSRPPEPTPKRRDEGSPEPDGNVVREGGPAMRAELRLLCQVVRSIIEQRLHLVTWLDLDQGCSEIERFGHQPLHLRDDLFDDVARFVRVRTGHDQRKLERTN